MKSCGNFSSPRIKIKQKDYGKSCSNCPWAIQHDVILGSQQELPPRGSPTGGDEDEDEDEESCCCRRDGNGWGRERGSSWCPCTGVGGEAMEVRRALAGFWGAGGDEKQLGWVAAAAGRSRGLSEVPKSISACSRSSSSQGR